MTPEELIAALTANAERVSKPVSIIVKGVGTIYVRRRTVSEFESLATLKSETVSEDGVGKFAPVLAGLLCDESGMRYPEEIRDRLATTLAKQPEEVFHKITSAADGEDDKATDAGN